MASGYDFTARIILKQSQPCHILSFRINVGGKGQANERTKEADTLSTIWL